MRHDRLVYTALLLLATVAAVLGWFTVQQRPGRIADSMLAAVHAELSGGAVADAMRKVQATIVEGTAVADHCTPAPARCTYKATMAYRMEETGDEPATFVMLEASTDVDRSVGAPPIPGPWRWQVIMAGFGEHRSVNVATGTYANLASTPPARGTNASLVLLKAMESGIEKGLAQRG
ncbi:MAG: hypothetical protein ACJ8HI_20365 [Massilia sp.]